MTDRSFLRAGEQMLPCFFVVLTICSTAGCDRSNQPPQPLSDNRSEPAANPPATKTPEASVQDLLSFETERQTANSRRINLRDVAQELGIHFSRDSDVVPGRFFLPEVMGGGVGWIDFDLDGLRDLFAVNGSPVWQDQPSTDSKHLSRIFRLRNQKFLDVTSVADVGNGNYGQGCAVGDYDADGFPDLYVTNYGRNVLFRNNGDGTFLDATTEAGVAGNEWSTSAVWLDADSDGLNDLYVTNYVDLTRENHKTCQYKDGDGYCGPGAWNGVADRLYLNNGAGQFVEQLSDSWGVSAADAKGLAVIAADFDSDRIPEIYVGNDMMPNFLLKRRADLDTKAGAGLYENIANAAGCAVSNEGMNEASMGVACADFDGNGLIDIFLTHYYESKNTLYRNLGQLLFEDASRQTRIAATSYDKLGFGTVAFDANLDGTADLFIANGHVLGPNHHPNEMTAQVLMNDGVGMFTDISSNCGPYFSELCLGRGAAGADFDDDGRLDIAVSHLDRPLALLHNQSESVEHFVGIELLSRDRCHPIGAIVKVTSAEGEKSVSVMGGGSYLSANDTRLIVTIGKHAKDVTVSVHWPSGETTEHQNLQADRYWRLSEFGDADSGRGRVNQGQSGGSVHD